METPPQEIPEQLEQRQERKEAEVAAAEVALPAKGEMFMAAIGYISFLCILPLVLMQGSKFCRYHGKQALVLAVFIYFLDAFQLFPAKYSVVYVALKLGIVIYALLRCLRGQYFSIPLVSDLSDRFQIEFKP